MRRGTRRVIMATDFSDSQSFIVMLMIPFLEQSRVCGNAY